MPCTISGSCLACTVTRVHTLKAPCICPVAYTSSAPCTCVLQVRFDGWVDEGRGYKLVTAYADSMAGPGSAIVDG